MTNQYSQEHYEFLKREKRKKATKITLQITIFVLFFAAWELTASLGILNPFIFSSPSRCIAMLSTLWGNGLLTHIGITLAETLAGFLLGSILGFLIAVILWWSPMTRAVLDPYLVVLNSLPKVALRTSYYNLGRGRNSCNYCYGCCNFPCCNYIRKFKWIFKN